MITSLPALVSLWAPAFLQALRNVRFRLYHKIAAFDAKNSIKGPGKAGSSFLDNGQDVVRHSNAGKCVSGLLQWRNFSLIASTTKLTYAHNVHYGNAKEQPVDAQQASPHSLCTSHPFMDPRIAKKWMAMPFVALLMHLGNGRRAKITETGKANCYCFANFGTSKRAIERRKLRWFCHFEKRQILRISCEFTMDQR